MTKTRTKMPHKRRKPKIDPTLEILKNESETLFKLQFKQGCNEEEQEISDELSLFEIPAVFEEYFEPFRYKVAYGGRGSAKSWSFAAMLIILATQSKKRVLCCREYQTNIGQSVHQLLSDTIRRQGLEHLYDITKTLIKCTHTGSEFIFKGLHENPAEIKSLENVDICWVEEGQRVSKTSWEVLIPTIRAENSEIWVSFNPVLESDETFQRFIVKTPENSLVKKVNFVDNPFFPEVLRKEAEHKLKTDPEGYKNVWLGECIRYSNAQIFKDKYTVTGFETPANARFYHGVDWGFSQDPTVLIRCYVEGNNLYIDKEVYGIGIDLDQMTAFFGAVENIKKQPIGADNARPETIHFMKKRGFNIFGAKKWGGSVQDGVSILKGFDKIYIHESCKRTADEFRLYSYRVDPVSDEILPVIEDKNNHCIDALRYALDKYIRGRRSMKF